MPQTRKRTLVAGVWIGEFGWELLSWQAYIRRQSRNYDQTYIIGPETSRHLYSDFYTSYLPIDLGGSPNCWWNDGIPPEKLLEAEGLLRTQDCDFISPSRLTGPIPIADQEFIRFGDAGKCAGRIVVHARDRKHRLNASWPQEKWDELTARLNTEGFRVMAIGTKALLPKGAEDARGGDLKETVDLLASAQISIGPSSGPMHLASLCATPHLVWADSSVHPLFNGTTQERYERTWNPFQTPVKVLDRTWQPEVQDVFKATLDFLHHAK